MLLYIYKAFLVYMNFMLCAIAYNRILNFTYFSCKVLDSFRCHFIHIFRHFISQYICFISINTSVYESFYHSCFCFF